MSDKFTPRFRESLRFVLKWEGGYTNHPADPGGATNMGIIQKVYDAWRTKKGLPRRPVKEITRDEVEQIYWENYWTPLKCSELPKPLDLAVFDSGVNCGVGRAALWLNTALNLPAAMKVSAKTVEEARKLNPLAIARKVLDQREKHYRTIVEKNPKLKVFLKGWLNRLNDLRKEISGK